MKAEELLKIDFSKYKNLLLDGGVFAEIENAEIVTKKDKDEVIIAVLINEECVVQIFYKVNDEVEVSELSYGCLSISRKEEKKR